MIKPLSLLLIFIGLLYIAISAYSISKQRSRISALFSLMTISIAIYVTGYGLELHSSSLGQMMFFIKMEYFGAPYASVFWLLFSYKFYFNKTPGFKLSILLMVIPILTTFFNVTNEYHRLFYRDVAVVEANGYIIAHLIKGPWYYVYVSYSCAAIIIGILAFYMAWRKALYAMKEESLLMLIGSLCPAIAALAYLSGLSPDGFDLAPFGLCMSSIFFFVALFKYDFLERGEIMRSVAFSETSEGIVFADEKGRLVDFNNAAGKVFGWLDKRNIGKDLACFDEGREIVNQRYSHFELEVDRGGRFHYYEFNAMKLMDKGRVLGTIFYFRDITKLKELIHTMETMASYDALSQVYSRRRLMEEARKVAARSVGKRNLLSVLMIDIDYFKQINDSYGHLAGDEVIKKVADACRECIRSTDIVGRFGGEEFLIILPGSALEDSLKIAENIRKRVEGLEILHGENRINTTVSIGVASASGADGNIDIIEIINMADMALYNAKAGGRNRISSETKPFSER